MKTVSLELFPAEDFILTAGSSGRLVTGIQLILQALGEQYKNIPFVQPGRFDEQTGRAVAVIQQKAGLPPTGTVDAPTWNHIALLYNFASKTFFRAHPHQS